MRLVIGGRGAGKKEYVKSLGYTDADFTDNFESDGAVLYDLEKTVRNNPDSLDGIYRSAGDREVVICCEVGCGIIPIDRDEESYRESVGRLCCMLAEKADCVVRVVAGIPQIIKGETK